MNRNKDNYQLLLYKRQHKELTIKAEQIKSELQKINTEILDLDKKISYIESKEYFDKKKVSL